MIRFILFLSVMLLLVPACSDEENASSEKKLTGDHVWKEQTETLDRAKEVEALIQDTVDKQSKEIEDQMQ